MDRIYNNLVQTHLKQDTQMLFLSGPRQVGKTTISKATESFTNHFMYLNWDDVEHREIILNGTNNIISHLHLSEMQEKKPILVLDEIHKYSNWKNFLKGLYDRFANKVHIIVTGSSRLDIYKKGGDSLMGRYFPYRIHPLSVAEILKQPSIDNLISPPKQIKQELFNHLYQFGGFPDPFLKHNPRFSQRWQRLRQQQLFQEDIRDANTITDINRLELLAQFIVNQSGSGMNYSSLAKKIRASVDTVTRWIELLETFYFCFLLRPWSHNVTRSLVKEPKAFLWDWALCRDPGSRAENFVASHLLKATHLWTDIGLGEFNLYYLRDLEKHEVDFIVTKDQEPWFLVEVKMSNNSGLNPNLKYFQQQTKAKHAFQVVIDQPYINQNCFDYNEPIIVPALTFLSQLV